MCTVVHADGRPCGAPPLRNGTRCYWHSPETKDALTEAQQVGRHRRSREQTVGAAYDFAGVRSLGDIRRAVDILLVDALSMENTPARGRLVDAAITTAIKLWELERFEGDGEEE